MLIATKNYDKDQAPGSFSTKLSAGADRATHVLFYRRVPREPAVDTPNTKPAAKEEEQAIANDLKSLQGQWLLVNKEQNGDGAPWPFQPEQGIYVEKNKITAVTRKGKILDESTAAEFSIDPLKNLKTMDFFMVDGGRRGQPWVAVYRIEGDQLTIAANRPLDGARLDFRPTCPPAASVRCSL